MNEQDNIVWTKAKVPPGLIEEMRQRFDEEQIEALLEDFVPLPDLYPEEFQRYYDLFIKYFPKTPCHVKSRYDRGFVCIQGRRKSGEPFNIPCYPALVAKMLDYGRWKTLHPDKVHYDACWIALREPRKTALTAIDFDNKGSVPPIIVAVARRTMRRSVP